MGADQLELGVYLDHGQAASGRGDRVAFPGVRLFSKPQPVEFGLEGGPVDGRGQCIGGADRRPADVY